MRAQSAQRASRAGEPRGTGRLSSAGQRRRQPRGFTLIELLIGLLIGLGTIAALTSALTVSLAARVRAAAGAETLAAAAIAIDQIARDVRLAGYDPRRSGLDGIVAAESASLVLEADLDGDGVIDPSSEEHVEYRRSAGASLLRVVGAQSMPLLSDLTPDGPAFNYFDVDGNALDPTAPGAAAAVRTVSVELATVPSAGLPGVRMSGGARMLNR